MQGPTPQPLPFPAAPTHCPFGHPLGPGEVLVGWYPCHCEWALISDETGQPWRGHHTHQCVACLKLPRRRETIDFWPPHKVDRTGPDEPGPGRTAPTDLAI